jgi:hypothetical protein
MRQRTIMIDSLSQLSRPQKKKILRTFRSTGLIRRIAAELAPPVSPAAVSQVFWAKGKSARIETALLKAINAEKGGTPCSQHINPTTTPNTLSL